MHPFVNQISAFKKGPDRIDDLVKGHFPAQFNFLKALEPDLLRKIPDTNVYDFFYRTAEIIFKESVYW